MEMFMLHKLLNQFDLCSDWSKRIYFWEQAQKQQINGNPLRAADCELKNTALFAPGNLMEESCS